MSATAWRRTGLLGVALGAVALWASGRMTWVVADVSNHLSGESTHRIGGGVWAAELTPVALMLVALIAALFLVGPWVARGLGVVAALVAGGEGVRLVVLALAGADAGRTHEILTSVSGGGGSTRTGTGGVPGGGTVVPAWAEVVDTSLQPAAVAVAILGAVFATAGGVIIGLVAGRVGAARSGDVGRYETPTVRREEVAAQAGAAESIVVGAAALGGADSMSQVGGGTVPSAPDVRPVSGTATPNGRKAGGQRAAEKQTPVTSRSMWDALDAGEDPTA